MGNRQSVMSISLSVRPEGYPPKSANSRKIMQILFTGVGNQILPGCPIPDLFTACAATLPRWRRRNYPGA